MSCFVCCTGTVHEYCLEFRHKLNKKRRNKQHGWLFKITVLSALRVVRKIEDEG